MVNCVLLMNFNMMFNLLWRNQWWIFSFIDGF